MDSDIKGIRDILEDAARDELDSKMQIEWSQLQQKARIFLSQAAKFEVDKIQQQSISKVISINTILEQQTLSTDIIKSANNSRNFYKLLFDFDKALTSYLGEMPKRALFVCFNSRGEPSTYEMSLDELVEISSRRGRIWGLNQNGLKAIEEQISEKAKGDFEHKTKGVHAASGVTNRLARFYQNRGVKQIDGKNIKAQKSGGLLMWKENGAWHIAKVANQGVVGEAYTAFLLTKHKTKQDYLLGVDSGSYPYYSHSLISKFYKYLSSVTNMPSIVEEDVYTEWAQYAIKTGKSSLPSIGQYIRTAYSILSSQEEIAPKNLKNMIKLAFQKDSQLAPFLGKVADTSIDEELSKLLDSWNFVDYNTQGMIQFE